MKYFFRVNNPQKDVHRPSPGSKMADTQVRPNEKRSFFAYNNRKVRQSEHLLSIVFIYLIFLWIKSGRGEHRAVAMFTK
jgi:hypothetical protein